MTSTVPVGLSILNTPFMSSKLKVHFPAALGTPRPFHHSQLYTMERGWMTWSCGEEAPTCPKPQRDLWGLPWPGSGRDHTLGLGPYCWAGPLPHRIREFLRISGPGQAPR